MTENAGTPQPDHLPSEPAAQGESSQRKGGLFGCLVKIFLLLALLLVAIVAWYFISKANADDRFNDYIKQQTEDGVVLSIDQVVDSDYSAKRADLDTTTEWQNSIEFFNSQETITRLQEFPKFGNLSTYSWPPTEWRQFENAAQLMEDFKKPLIELQFATAGFAFWSEEDLQQNTLSPEALQGLNRALEFMVLSCFVAAHQEDQDQLVIRLLACLGFSRSLAQHPGFITLSLELDRQAIQLLMSAVAKVNFREADLVKFRDRLLELDYWPRFASDWDFQRAMRLLMYNDPERFQSTYLYREMQALPAFEEFLKNLPFQMEYSPFSGDDAVRFLQLMSERKALFSGDFFAAADELAELEEAGDVTLEGWDQYRYPTASAMVPEISQQIREAGRGEVYRNVALGMLAVDQFRVREGALPKSLSEAVRGFLVEEPIDAYVGKPLKFSNKSPTVLVSSLGPNQVNNLGGKDDIGIAIPLKKWDPAAEPIDQLD
ncbi:MAG: hypothetical protein P8I27_12720 [Pirellulaceae bacterium]|nr:hypothetical protein [Pirellulaceae bacterium]